MAITVFDAVGKFTADTRNLDDFIVKLDRALPDASQKSAVASKVLKDAQDNLRESLKTLRQEGGDTAANWQKVADAQRQLAIASGAAKRSQDDLRQSIGAVKESTKEARGEIGLIGELFGIHLPRHVRSFIAELPGVGKALTAAFAVTAVYFIVEALGEAELKIEEVIRALGGWTEAAKKAYESQVKLNETFIELADAREEAEIRSKERGLEGARLTKQQIEDNKEILKVVGERLTALTRERGALQSQLDVLNTVGAATAAWAKGSTFIEERKEKIESLGKSIEAIDARILGAIKEQFSLTQQQSDKGVQLHQQTLTQYIATENAKVQAKKDSANAQLETDLALFRNEFEAHIISGSALVDLEKETEEKKYQVDLAALKEKERLLKLDPTRNVDAIIATNAAIEVLEQKHNQKLLDQDTAMLRAKNEIARQSRLLGSPSNPLETSSIPDVIKLSPNNQALLLATEILAKLGDATSQAAKKAGEAQAAYDILVQTIEGDSKPAIESNQLLVDSFDAFKESIHGLRISELQALRIVLQEEINSSKEWGRSTDELEKKLSATEKVIRSMGVAIDRVNQGTARAPQLLDVWSQHLLKNRQNITQTQKTFDAFTLSFTDAFGSAIQQWVTHQKSFGEALEQALAQELAVIAAKSAAWALYFAAWGIADSFWNPPRATADFIAAAEFGALAAVTGGLAAALTPRSDNNSGGSTDNTISSPAATSVPNPVQVQNVQHFATGGLITSPTLAVIGDSLRSSSGQREAAIPLDDPDAIRPIVEALGGSRGGDTHVHVRGLISADTLSKFTTKLNRGVKRGQVKLVASNSYRVTRKA